MVELGSWMVGLVELVEGEKVLLDRIMGEDMGGKYNVVVKVWDEKTWLFLSIPFNSHQFKFKKKGHLILNDST